MSKLEGLYTQRVVVVMLVTFLSLLLFSWKQKTIVNAKYNHNYHVPPSTPLLVHVQGNHPNGDFWCSCGAVTKRQGQGRWRNSRRQPLDPNACHIILCDIMHWPWCISHVRFLHTPVLMSYSSHRNLWKSTPNYALITLHVNIIRMKCNEACCIKCIIQGTPLPKFNFHVIFKRFHLNPWWHVA